MISSTSETTAFKNTYVYPRRRRRCYTMAQVKKLEAAFEKSDGYIDTKVNDLAQQVDLDETSIKVWFCNRRAKLRRQTQPTTSVHVHPIQRPEIRPATETTTWKPTKGFRKLIDLSNLQPKHNIINTGRCFEHRKKLQCQQSELPSNPCHKQSHTTEIRKPEHKSSSFVASSLDCRSEKNCKHTASAVNITGLLDKPKKDKVFNQTSTEASNSGTADKQVSSPLMVYSVQKFSPTCIPRVLPMKDNHYDGSHVKKKAITHLPHERPSTFLRRILPKPLVPSSLTESQEGHLQNSDGSSNVPSLKEPSGFHSGNSGMCLPHVTTSEQHPPKSVVDRGQNTEVADKDDPVQHRFPEKITVESKEQDSSLTNSRQEASSVKSDGPRLQHPAMDEVSFFSAMCDIDTDWNPLPDDVAVMFNSYRERPDCSEGVEVADATESEATVVEKNVHLPFLLR